MPAHLQRTPSHACCFSHSSSSRRRPMHGQALRRPREQQPLLRARRRRGQRLRHPGRGGRCPQQQAPLARQVAVQVGALACGPRITELPVNMGIHMFSESIHLIDGRPPAAVLQAPRCCCRRLCTLARCSCCVPPMEGQRRRLRQSPSAMTNRLLEYHPRSPLNLAAAARLSSPVSRQRPCWACTACAITARERQPCAGGHWTSSHSWLT